MMKAPPQSGNVHESWASSGSLIPHWLRWQPNPLAFATVNYSHLANEERAGGGAVSYGCIEWDPGESTHLCPQSKRLAIGGTG